MPTRYQFFLGRTGAATAAAAATLLDALEDYLTTVGPLAGLGGRVYLSMTGVRPTYPLLVMDALPIEVEENNSDTYLSWEPVQFTVLSTDDLEADKLGRRAWRALLPKPQNPAMVFADGEEVTRLPGGYRPPVMQPQPGPQGNPIFGVSFDIRWLLTRQM